MRARHAATTAALCIVIVVSAVGSSSAQISLVGEWTPRYHEDHPDCIPGPEPGDYTGLPLTPGARLAADTWNASRLTLPEHQCKVRANRVGHDLPVTSRWRVSARQAMPLST